MDYHGIFVKDGLKNESVLKEMKILGQKISRNWVLLKVLVEENKIKELVVKVQKSLKTNPNFYVHFYRSDELIVIFPQKIFYIKPDKSTWKEAIEFGKSLGIPEKQLDFHPCRIEDETY
jgi:hypothetical protein